MTDAALRCSLRVLLVDDEPDLYLACAEVLRCAGHEVHTARDREQVVQLMTSVTIDVVLTEIRLPKREALSLLRMVPERWPATIVVLVTASVELQQARAALSNGIHDYLRKPIDGDDIALRIERIAAQVSIQRQRCKARLDLARREPSEQIVGRSHVMCRMMDRLNAIAARDVSVLLLGETGTGKDLAARTINDRGPRQGKPFVAVNCAAFPDRLLEAELFGDERSARAGAGARRSGRFAAAHGGTLLLEEVGDMSTALQGKLLRVLETRAIEPLGTNGSIGVDVRVISTTNRPRADGRGRPPPGGSLPSLERSQSRPAAAAGAGGRPAASRPVLPEPIPSSRQRADTAVARRLERSHGLRISRQRAPTWTGDRARHHHGERSRDRAGTSSRGDHRRAWRDDDRPPIADPSPRGARGRVASGGADDCHSK